MNQMKRAIQKTYAIVGKYPKSDKVKLPDTLLRLVENTKGICLALQLKSFVYTREVSRGVCIY